MFKFVIIYFIIINNVYSYSSKYVHSSNMNSYINQLDLFNKVVGGKSGFLGLLSDVNKYSEFFKYI